MSRTPAAILTVLALGTALVAVTCRPCDCPSQTPDPGSDHEGLTAYVSNTDQGATDSDVYDSGETDLRDTVQEEPIVTMTTPDPAALEQLTAQAEAYNHRCLDLWITQESTLDMAIATRDKYAPALKWRREQLTTNEVFQAYVMAQWTKNYYANTVARTEQEANELGDEVQLFATQHPELNANTFDLIPPQGWPKRLDKCFKSPIPKIGGLN